MTEQKVYLKNDTIEDIIEVLTPFLSADDLESLEKIFDLDEGMVNVYTDKEGIFIIPDEVQTTVNYYMCGLL